MRPEASGGGRKGGVALVLEADANTVADAMRQLAGEKRLQRGTIRQ